MCVKVKNLLKENLWKSLCMIAIKKKKTLKNLTFLEKKLTSNNFLG